MVEQVSNSESREDEPSQSLEALRNRVDALWIEAHEVDNQYAEVLAKTPDDRDAFVRVQGEMDRISAEIAALEEQISRKFTE